MQFIRPFTSESLHFLKKSRALGFDFIELLVPEPKTGSTRPRCGASARARGWASFWPRA